MKKSQRLKPLLIVITLLLILSSLLTTHVSADETVNIVKSRSDYQYFLDYNNGWTTLGTPFYTTNGKVTYCLEHKVSSPKDDTVYIAGTTPWDYFTPRVLWGVQIILKNGYPNENGGLTDNQARYATANAIRFWLSEEGMPQQYNYTNLSDVDLDALAKNGYASGCRIKANPNAPNSIATLSFAIELLKLAREQAFTETKVIFSPENISLTKQGENYIGETTVTLQGYEGNYALNEDNLPSGTVITGYTGNTGDVLSISIPASSINHDTNVELSGYGINIEPYGHAFWATPDENRQKMVYIGREFNPIGTGYLNLEIAGGWAEIYKTDRENGERLSDAVFELYDSSDNLIETLTTDTQGYAQSSFLEPDDYYFIETTAPYGYTLDNSAHSFTIEDDTSADTVSVDITNDVIRGYAEVLKTDIYDNLLEGAQFEVVKLSDEFEWIDGIDNAVLIGTSEEQVEIITTGTDGIATTSMLRVGKYYLREILPPEGYTLDDEIYYFEITPSNTYHYFEIYNHTNSDFGYLVVEKTDDISGEPIQGATFQIMVDDNIVEYIVTDSTGTARSSLLPIGSYTLVEEYPAAGYVVNSTTDHAIPFEITTVGEVVTIDGLTNTKIYGDVTISKFDIEDNEPLQGAVFGIYDLETDELITEVTTNTNGIATYDRLEFATNGVMGLEGGYYVKELSPPDGYSLPDQSYAKDTAFYITTWNPSASVFIPNERSDYKIQINKVDEDGIPLEGARFEVYDDSDTLVERVTTDENGIAYTEELYYGDYYLVEIEAPDDYVLDSTPIYFSWHGGASNSITVINELAEGGKVAAFKTDENDNLLEGAQFELYDSSDNLIETLTTDSRGEAISSLLPYGNYYLVETAAPTGYEDNLDQTPIPVTVSNTDYITEINISNLSNGFVFTGQIEIRKRDAYTFDNLNGAVFEIRNDTDTIVDTVTTSIDGSCRTVQLPYGDYTIQEIIAPTNYKLNTGATTVNIDEALETYTFSNYPITEQIRITKVDVDTGEYLSGAVFDVYDSNNNVVDTLKTDDNGQDTSIMLPVGTYQLVETTAPSGYILDTTPHEVEILPADEIATNEITIENYPIFITFTKTDEYSNLLQGAHVQVFDDSDNLAFEGDTDGNGRYTIRVVTAGTYTFRETVAPSGYILDDTTYTIIVNEDGTINGDTDIINYPTAVEISKVVYEDNTALSGAGFEVRNSMGLTTLNFSRILTGVYIHDENGGYKELTVDSNGNLLILGLAVDDYWLVESTAPNGYLTTAPTAFSVESTHTTLNPNSLTIPNSQKVKLGKNILKRRLIIAAISGVILLLIILAIIFRKFTLKILKWIWKHLKSFSKFLVQKAKQFLKFIRTLFEKKTDGKDKK